ncbi:MAG TPA: DUF72 domain-containing protein [Bacteriovoracaceae bacterium]|nr:DUF72 domain-containing protein [Bacteriovoracaceae bacterium]
MKIGTAGWSIPEDFADNFVPDGSHLQRYSQEFNMVEINSSFYKEHLSKTYLRWASDVPDDFRFSVKISKAFTHDSGLRPKFRDVYASLDNSGTKKYQLGFKRFPVAYA